MRRYTPYLLLIAFVLLLLVLIPGFGVEGQRRAPLARRRPAAVPARRAHEARARPARGGGHRRAAQARAATCAPRPAPILGVGAAAVLLVAAQPDLGTALVICFTLAAMLVAAGLPLRQLGLVAGRRRVPRARVRDPRALPARAPDRVPRTRGRTPAAAASSPSRARSRSARAGFFGLGPGQSVQKIFYLPEAHTDFILAVIGEELGVAGICVLLVPLRHDRVRGAADRQGRQGRLRQAARRRPHRA